MQTDTETCRDGCGTVVPNLKDPALGAWTYLAISGRWRCPACRKALEKVDNKEKTVHE